MKDYNAHKTDIASSRKQTESATGLKNCKFIAANVSMHLQSLKFFFAYLPKLQTGCLIDYSSPKFALSFIHEDSVCVALKYLSVIHRYISCNWYVCTFLYE